MRIDSLPDGCNRLDESWSRDHINGPDYEEIFDLTGPITKEEFTFFFEDEIEEQNEREMEFDNLVESHSSNNDGDMDMIKQNVPYIPSEDIEYCFHGINMETCIGCGECKTIIGWTPEGALAGKPIIVRTLEEDRDFKRIEKSQSWKEFSKETHQHIEDMRFKRLTSPSRNMDFDLEIQDFVPKYKTLFGREAQGIDEPTIINDLIDW